MTLPSRLDLAIRQIQFARDYTRSLLVDVADDDWFRQPAGGVSHLAWQVGHLAMAQYGLCLFRMRGRQPVDLELMSSAFRKKFSRGSIPDPDPAKNPQPQEILQVFERIHAQVLQELPQLDDAVLDEPIDDPWAVFPTKQGGLIFCATHEMLHAGQIGLLRRLIGKSPIR
ncbi:MAG: DinB family protein [Planctomycetaceae bacterium]|nr:DinB family protein [Planctomycetaceae bacterium]MCA9066379.1 DinB family protein [Planctomycetaceae bacterium]